LNRYSNGAIILHWLLALLIIGNLAGGLLHDYVPAAGGQRSLVMSLHKSFGISILALTLVRLGWRLANPPPPLPEYLAANEQLLAKAAHWAFYAAMLALPLSGWVMADRTDRPIPFFGLAEVPKFGVAKPLADAAHELHETMGWALLALLALHVTGIIKHRWLDQANLLPRMGLGRSR
jgi:cytochrome b561